MLVSGASTATALIWIMQGSPLGDLTDEIELLTFALGADEE